MESTARAQPFLLLTEARPGEVKDPSHHTQEVTVHGGNSWAVAAHKFKCRILHTPSCVFREGLR